METLIDKKSHQAKKYHREKFNKTQIIIGNGLRKGNNHLIRLKNKDFGKTTKYPMFSVMRNGDVFQHYNDFYYSDFIGDKIVDAKSITIVMENMGWLKKEGKYYYNWVNELCEDGIEKKRWVGYDYWQGYTEEQISSLSKLCTFLCEKHDILKSVIGFHHHHKDMSNYKGVVLRSNHVENSTDTNPFFSLSILQKKIKEVSESHKPHLQK